MSAVPEFAWTPDPKTELEFLFENMPFAVAKCHRHGGITALNRTMERLLGEKFKSVKPLSWNDLFHPQDGDEGAWLCRELFAGERETFQLDATITGAEDRKLRWTVWRVFDTNGRSDYALAIAQNLENDPSESIKAEQRLRQAQKLEAVGRLAGGIAHDFNNLLTGVLLYCDLLIASLTPASLSPADLEPVGLKPTCFEQDDVESTSRVRKYAEEIRKASLQATGVVRQLLAVARPQSYEPGFISLNEIVEGMRNLLVRLIGENIELTFQLDSKLGLIKIDPTQAQQILLNLVLNSRDAMPTGGRITIETSSCRVQVLTENHSGAGEPTSLPCAMFVVSDNGGGMDAATRAHMFEAFFTTKGEGRGTGLGLTTVYDIVTRNGGFIHVDSAPGCGTRVIVLLRLVPESAMNSQPERDLQVREKRGGLP